MDFYSLHLLVNQLAKHPQIHPNTQIEVEHLDEEWRKEKISTTEPLVSISVLAGKLVFSTIDHNNAVGR